MLWCESCDAADIRSGDWSGDWSCDRLGNKGRGRSRDLKRRKVGRKEKCALERNMLAWQLIYSQHYFKSHFSMRSCIRWLPDSFSLTGTLPQIMWEAGMEYFFTEAELVSTHVCGSCAIADMRK